MLRWLAPPPPSCPQHLRWAQVVIWHRKWQGAQVAVPPPPWSPAPQVGSSGQLRLYNTPPIGGQVPYSVTFSHSGPPFLAPLIRRVLIFYFGWTPLLGWTPLPPPPPFTPHLVPPPPGQKGYQYAPYSNKHPSAYSSRPEIETLQSYGDRLSYGRPCTHTRPTRHP